MAWKLLPEAAAAPLPAAAASPLLFLDQEWGFAMKEQEHSQHRQREVGYKSQL